MHCFSNYLISDSEKAALSFQKLRFVDEPFAVLDDKRAAAVMFPNTQLYAAFCKNVISGLKAWDLARSMEENFQIQGLVDIGIIGNFIQCITGNFESRYFNTLKGNEYTLVKTSTNKKKIKAEYNFYHLLPEDMRFWFVMPFHYREGEETASYTMERLHMTDLAIKWVHGSMDEAEFADLMDKYFFFFQSRHTRTCTTEEYQKTADRLYIEKVNNRIACLKRLPEYKKIGTLLDITPDARIDYLVQQYYELKERIEAHTYYPPILAIGHGDPCFANALYNKST